jgi:Rrf2 family protein
MYLSKASTYGIRSVAFLASKEEHAVISVREMSSELDIPAAFLTKIMQRLASRSIVETMRGFGGGIALGKPAAEITLKDIITAIEGDDSFPYFWLGIPEDQLEKIPVFHQKWSGLIDKIDRFFSETRLTELAPSNGNDAESPGSMETPDIRESESVLSVSNSNNNHSH